MRLDFVVPDGFVNLQVTGAGGVLFTEVPTVETWQAILSVRRYYGSSAIFLTPVADAPKRLEQAAGAVMQAIDIYHILDIRLEDHHISSAHIGTHCL